VHSEAEAIWGERKIPIELSPSGLITRAEFVDYKHSANSLLPVHGSSDMVGEMAIFLLK
jgi:hypothetical protein